MIIAAVLPWVMAALALALAMSAWRLFRGPGLPDRILALDTLYINAMALLIVLGLWLDTKSYFEIAMLIALLGFVSTVALCKYAARGDIAE